MVSKSNTDGATLALHPSTCTLSLTGTTPSGHRSRSQVVPQGADSESRCPRSDADTSKVCEVLHLEEAVAPSRHSGAWPAWQAGDEKVCSHPEKTPANAVCMLDDSTNLGQTSCTKCMSSNPAA